MDDLMEQVQRRLDAYARAGEAAAGAGDAAAARGRGSRLRLERRLAQGSAALLLVVGLAGGAALAGARSGDRDVAPAGDGQVPATTAGRRPAGPAVDGIVQAPSPQVVRTADSIELKGRTGQGRTWSYLLAKRPGGVCQLGDLDRDAPGRSLKPEPTGMCGSLGGAGFGTRVRPILARELNTVKDGCGSVAGDAQPTGDDQWETLLTGLAGPEVDRIRLELLDGRVMEVRPVATDLFEARPFAVYLNQCIVGVTTVAYRADGSVLSRSPGTAGSPPQLGQWLADVRFDRRVTGERRTELLVALERGGAQLYEAGNGRYKLSVQVQQQWGAVKDRLEAARREGLVQFTTERSPDLTAQMTDGLPG
jgi:hypothetical protein